MPGVFVVVGAPAGMRQAVGDAQLSRLERAHPSVRVEITHDHARFAELLPEADGAIVFLDFAALLGPALRPGSRLRWVQSITAGVGHLLIPEMLAADHVTLTATKGPMGPLMAEHVVLLMLALARDLPGFLHDQGERHWRHLASERPMLDLWGRTVAILGVGSVGGSLARICKLAFGMRVLGLARTRLNDPNVDRYFERSALHAALAEADFVVLTLALTPETAGIVNAAALAAMKPSAYLINVTRGALVDEDALIAALRMGQIAGAGLDSVSTEPLPPESPLWSLPNVIITPHVSPGRDRFGAEVVSFWCENVRRFAEGEPLLGAVDRAAGY
jgi:phosphoglycerate dehydrogenase-like enzyme